ncbi:hypothetical protein RCL1_006553 [Eukaryota sp. TZLM3-RCL]
MSVSKSEAELYDRQIRIWGLEGQCKLKTGRVWITGSLSALGLEVGKNIVLSGVGSLFLVDNSLLTADDVEQSFFFEPIHIGKSKSYAAQQHLSTLNLNCNVFAVDMLTPIEGDLVVFCGLTKDLSLFTSLRSQKISCILCDSFNDCGVIFIDFGESFSYIWNSQKMTNHYVSLESLIHKLESFCFPAFVPHKTVVLLYNYFSLVTRNSLPSTSELSTVLLSLATNKRKPIPSQDELSEFSSLFSACSSYTTDMVVGGLVSQEVIKFFTRAGSPIDNTVVVDLNGGAPQIKIS